MNLLNFIPNIPLQGHLDHAKACIPVMARPKIKPDPVSASRFGYNTS